MHGRGLRIAYHALDPQDVDTLGTTRPRTLGLAGCFLKISLALYYDGFLRRCVVITAKLAGRGRTKENRKLQYPGLSRSLTLEKPDNASLSRHGS